MAGFTRPPNGFRFDFGGVKTNDTADALPPNKSPYAQNIRSFGGNLIRTRPGYRRLFSVDSSAVTDMRAYSTLGTDNEPRILARNASNGIYLDDENLVGVLDGSALGACFIPYRPNQSPQAWMYIGTAGDYQKFSAPDASNNVTKYNAGIQEQPNPPDACPEPFNYYDFSGVASDWTNGGTAGGLSDATRVSDTAGSVIADPASGSVDRCSVQVSTTKSYQRGMLVVIDSTITTVVEDVIPPVNAGSSIEIESIQYYSGTTGRCVIVPTQTPSNPSVPTFANNSPITASIYSDNVISSLRRGALISLVGSTTETCFVLSVTAGPTGVICFEVETVGNFVATDNINGLPTIIVSGVTSANSGDSITSADISSTLSGAGTATISRALATNPFNAPLAPANVTPQQDDYVAFGINLSDLSVLTIGTIIFNTNPVVDYVTNGFYAEFTTADLIFHEPSAPSPYTVNETQIFDPDTGELIRVDQEIITSLTPLPSSQWTTVQIPIRRLKRLGNDLTKTLADCNGVRLKLQTTAGATLLIGSFWVGGGGQADVGTQGSPLYYATVGRNSITGARSNPSPSTRYGVSPRRQQVRVPVRDGISDQQLDTWDIYRYGGTINSWRYIGSMPNTGGADVFIDNFFDTAAGAGSEIEHDNFQPWPTIDVPFVATAGTVNGITTTIEAVGTTVIVTYSAAVAFTNPIPSTVLRWLPGTLAIVGGQSAYTLWTRPTVFTPSTPPAAFYYAYLFQFIENIGTASPMEFTINEPIVANQHLPYLWGPDAAGTVFGAGDPLRSGSVYYCKGFTPDSAPDKYNQELTPPSEPQLGGEIINGLSFAASTERWWALYPQFGTSQRYQAVEKPVGRGLAAPYGKCTDGKNIFFWAKDGIWKHSGGPGSSLTDADLYNLFPHEGANTPVNYTYGAYTIYAPDYKYAACFRLSICNGYLYADYRDSTGTYRTLVCDVRGLDVEGWMPKWQPDVYAVPVTCHYAIEQQESTLEAATETYPLLLLGDIAGDVHEQAENTNDNGTAIAGVLGTFEFNGGDLRGDQQFNDAFVDVKPVSGLTVTPMSGRTAAASAVSIAATSARVQTAKVAIGQELKYLGLLFVWTDDFDDQSVPTELYAWQPLFESVPISVFLWKPQGTSFGMKGYGHIRQVNFAYRSTAEVVLTVTTYDGQSPDPIVMPSTGGEYRKTMFPFTPNKGMLFFVQAVCADAEWTPYMDATEWYVGEWGREGPYTRYIDMPGPEGIA